MHTVGAFEAKTHFSQLLTAVEKEGEEIVIRRHGHNVAILKPYERERVYRSMEEAKKVVEGFREIREVFRQSGLKVSAKELINEGRK